MEAMGRWSFSATRISLCLSKHNKNQEDGASASHPAVLTSGKEQRICDLRVDCDNNVRFRESCTFVFVNMPLMVVYL